MRRFFKSTYHSLFCWNSSNYFSQETIASMRYATPFRCGIQPPLGAVYNPFKVRYTTPYSNFLDLFIRLKNSNTCGIQPPFNFHKELITRDINVFSLFFLVAYVRYTTPFNKKIDNYGVYNPLKMRRTTPFCAVYNPL